MKLPVPVAASCPACSPLPAHPGRWPSWSSPTHGGKATSSPHRNGPPSTVGRATIWPRFPIPAAIFIWNVLELEVLWHYDILWPSQVPWMARAGLTNLVRAWVYLTVTPNEPLSKKHSLPLIHMGRLYFPPTLHHITHLGYAKMGGSWRIAFLLSLPPTCLSFFLPFPNPSECVY